MSNNVGINVGNKLRKLRMDKGYSQEYLADVLGVSQRTYSNMENNKSSISVETLHKIAEEYGIDMVELLKEGQLVVQHNNSHDTSTLNGIFNNDMSEKLIEQFEQLKELIKEKDKRINDLEKRLS